TDHLIRDNEVRENGGPGVLFRKVKHRGGDRVALEGNRFCANGAEAADAEIVIADRIRDVVLRGNVFANVRAAAVKVGGAARGIHLARNRVDGRDLRQEDVEDPSGRAVWGERPEPLRVGPAAADKGSARHLAFELPPAPANFDL
ncbi:MAG: hypothetical protein KAX19_01755, partial [Candidatus Brocadiae bacterium]|nr:hypothetical protein [Candidatus Brocadiia bacterium]